MVSLEFQSFLGWRRINCLIISGTLLRGTQRSSVNLSGLASREGNTALRIRHNASLSSTVLAMRTATVLKGSIRLQISRACLSSPSRSPLASMICTAWVSPGTLRSVALRIHFRVRLSMNSRVVGIILPAMIFDTPWAAPSMDFKKTTCFSLPGVTAIISCNSFFSTYHLNVHVSRQPMEMRLLSLCSFWIWAIQHLSYMR